MDSITLFVLALGLSMDAFAVSISNSMCFSGLRRNEAALTSLSFGVFQGLMPVAGYFAGRAFADVVSAFDHWIAFALLGFIGGKMIWDAVKELRAPEAGGPRLHRPGHAAHGGGHQHRCAGCRRQLCRAGCEHRRGGFLHRLRHVRLLPCGPSAGQKIRQLAGR